MADNFSDRVEAIAVAIGSTMLALPTGQGMWLPCGSPHWEHIYDEGCAICKAGAAPWALRVLIDRVLELDRELEVTG